MHTAVGSECPQAGIICSGNGCGEGLPVCVHSDISVFGVVESCPTQAALIQAEAQGLDKVQLAAGVCTQAHDVARVWRDLRFE